MKYPHLLFLSFPNSISALSAVNAFPKDSEVIEFGQLHGGQITVWVSASANFLHGGVLEAVDGVFLEKPSPGLLKAYFKQMNTQVKRNLLVIESPKLSQVLTTVDGLLKTSSFEVIEISRGAGAFAHATAYLANGTSEEALMPAVSDLHIRLFEEPSAHVLKLFNIG